MHIVAKLKREIKTRRKWSLWCQLGSSMCLGDPSVSSKRVSIQHWVNYALKVSKGKKKSSNDTGRINRNKQHRLCGVHTGRASQFLTVNLQWGQTATWTHVHPRGLKTHALTHIHTQKMACMDSRRRWTSWGWWRWGPGGRRLPGTRLSRWLWWPPAPAAPLTPQGETQR